MKNSLLPTLAAICCIGFSAQAQFDLSNYVTNESATEYKVVANSSNGLVRPVDLDFHPTRDFELWVLNKAQFSSTVTIQDANSASPTFLQIEDGNAWHFMARGSALAFGENGNWGTAQGVQDANYSGGSFTGPSLWSSDYDNIYGVIGDPPSAQFNGSHLDMLHQSPYGMGIAHESGNVYWVFDGWNEHIVRYDFVDDHGPGQDDHSDGIVHRYQDVTVARDNSTTNVDNLVPSHMVIDKATGWLYIVDNGNKRIMRLDINSGTSGSTLPFNFEPLADYRNIDGVTFEILVDQGLDMPCGIDVYGDQLVVTDNGSKEIIIYDITDTGITEVGRVSPPDAIDLMGVKVDDNGQIWYVDKSRREVRHMINATVAPTSIEEDLSPSFVLDVYPNPATDMVRLSTEELIDEPMHNVRVMDIMGKVVHTEQVDLRNSVEIDLSKIANGVYTIEVGNSVASSTQQLVIQH